MKLQSRPSATLVGWPGGIAPVRAENLIHGSDQYSCSSGALPVMLTGHVVGAESGVTIADLVFAVVRSVRELGIWLREHGRIGHCQYSCHCDWLIWRCSACSAGLPCSPGPTEPKMPDPPRATVTGIDTTDRRKPILGGLINEYTHAT